MLEKIVKIEYLRHDMIYDFEIDQATETVWYDGDLDFEKATFIGTPSFSVSSKKSKAGTLFTHKASFLVKNLGSYMVAWIKKGVVLQLTSAAGELWILGSPDFPLQGTVIRKLPAAATDTSGYLIELEGKMLHDALLSRD